MQSLINELHKRSYRRDYSYLIITIQASAVSQLIQIVALRAVVRVEHLGDQLVLLSLVEVLVF